MRGRQRWRVFLLSGMLLASPLAAADETGDWVFHRKLRAEDGDSLITPKGVSFRLSCIDAPEYKMAGAEAAKKSLSALVAKGAFLKTQATDKYGRQVVIARVKNNDNDRHLINLQQVARGHAWVYRYHADTCGLPRELLCAAENKARQKKRGIWRARNAPIPPWRWRRNNHNNAFPPCETNR